MQFLKRIPRTAVAAVVLTAAAAGLAGVAAAFTADQPAGQVVQDQVVRQADAVDTTDTTSVEPTTTEPAPAPTEPTAVQPPVTGEPAPTSDEDPGPGLVDPVDEPQPTTTEPEPSVTVTLPAPPPAERCWMDDSDPVNYPNGREICVPTS